MQQVAEAAPDSFDRAPRDCARRRHPPRFPQGPRYPGRHGPGYPGFVVPQAIGNDINCGMRLHTTTLKPGRRRVKVDELETAFRHIYFEGGRNIPMTRGQRHAMFTRRP